MNLAFIEKVHENRASFAEKVVNISGKLGIEPGWLMGVMNSESGLNHRAVNPNGGATGLIQFMPATARHLGTTTAALLSMSNIEQLDWVYRYLKPFTGKMRDYTDVYFTIFFPLAVGKPDDWVFQARGLSAYAVARDNPVFDLNKDMKLTVGEVREAMMHRIPPELRESFKKKR
jgi:hypothetical protein